MRPFITRPSSARRRTSGFTSPRRRASLSGWQHRCNAFPSPDVLLFGLRVYAQNPNGFVVVGDALSAEPYASVLRKDDAPFNALTDHAMGRSEKGSSTGFTITHRFKSPASIKRARV